MVHGTCTILGDLYGTWRPRHDRISDVVLEALEALPSGTHDVPVIIIRII